MNYSELLAVQTQELLLVVAGRIKAWGSANEKEKAKLARDLEDISLIAVRSGAEPQNFNRHVNDVSKKVAAFIETWAKPSNRNWMERELRDIVMRSNEVGQLSVKAVKSVFYKDLEEYYRS